MSAASFRLTGSGGSLAGCRALSCTSGLKVTFLSVGRLRFAGGDDPLSAFTMVHSGSYSAVDLIFPSGASGSRRSSNVSVVGVSSSSSSSSSCRTILLISGIGSRVSRGPTSASPPATGECPSSSPPGVSASSSLFSIVSFFVKYREMLRELFAASAIFCCFLLPGRPAFVGLLRAALAAAAAAAFALMDDVAAEDASPLASPEPPLKNPPLLSDEVSDAEAFSSSFAARKGSDDPLKPAPTLLRFNWRGNKKKEEQEFISIMTTNCNVKPGSSSGTEREDDEGVSSLSLVSFSLLLSALTPSPFSPGAVFFNSDTFFRTAALYTLEDLVLLKTACSRSTARERVSLQRDGGDVKGELLQSVSCPLVAVDSFLQEAQAVLSGLK
ncbi:hypothetical protein EYF80_006367 [Liparis tanakae]|uniref:Uncharacterized protein n=1 Tax=Liparis tanakae TaxID=230148 RepID=A0A4Z2IZR3_9TELE|nr:hypothetical protein EYF80_006367 [Liparis tanakae]